MTIALTQKSANLHIRLHPDLKQAAFDILNRLGLSLTDFIQMSLHQVVQDKAVQFELSLLADDKEKDYTSVSSMDQLKQLINFKENVSA